MDGPDHLEIRDPRQMRALAHPLRLRILARLQVEGPATATALAGALGEGVSSISYHLRQLARHGYIDEEPTLARSRRERPWRARALGERLDRSRFESPASRPAATALMASYVEGAADIYLRYLDAIDEYSTAWRQATVYYGQTVHVTPDELADIGARLYAILLPYARFDPASRPDGAERVHFSLQGVPWRDI
jgi:DNA-binding transcriptional ArsR family regulator